MADERRTVDLQVVHEARDIRDLMSHVVARLRPVRCAASARRQADYLEPLCQPRGNIAEDERCVAPTRNEDERLAGPTPIGVMQMQASDGRDAALDACFKANGKQPGENKSRHADLDAPYGESLQPIQFPAARHAAIFSRAKS